MALDNKSPEYETFCKAAKNGRTAEVEQQLIEHPEFLDLPNDRGWTPLHHVAWYGHDSTVVLLLQHGSTSLDSINNSGWTPLHLATWDGSNFIVELLLQHGSTSLNSPDKDGRTPLHYAAWNEHYSTVTILKAAGAIILSLAHLNQKQIEMLQAPIPEEKVTEIRFRIYFSQPLLAQLLF